jgi:hypothetical protein
MMRRAWWLRGGAAVLVAALALGACGGDDDEEGGGDRSEEDSETTEESSGPATTASREEPPGTEPAEVQPYVEDLLQQYDALVGDIVADPEIAANQEHSLYVELRELMAPDSSMTQPVVDALVNQGERGVSQRPFEEGGPPIRREVAGDLTTVSEDEVTFPLCTRPNYRLFNSSDVQTEYSTGPSQLGQGTAQRVDGHWLIARFEVPEERETCPGEEP